MFQLAFLRQKKNAYILSKYQIKILLPEKKLDQMVILLCQKIYRNVPTRTPEYCCFFQNLLSWEIL